MTQPFPPYGAYQPPVPPRKAWPLRHKFLAASIAVVAAGGGAGAAYAAASPSQPGAAPGVWSYLCYNGPVGSGATLLQWKDAGGGVISGTYQQASVSGTAPAEQVSTDSGNLAGQVNGTGITVDLGGSSDIYGKLAGASLTLDVPQADGTIQPAACQQAGINAWNSALTALNRRTGSDNAVANAQQQQQQNTQQVSQDQSQLSSDTAQLAQDASSLDTDKSLAGDVQVMQQDLATEQNDWAAEQNDSCPNQNGDAGTVDGDSGNVDGDLGNLQGDVSNLQAEVSTVRQDLSTVQADVQAIQSLGGSVSPDPSAAIKAGNKTLSDTKKAIAWANGQGNGLDGQAHQIASQADAYANSASC